MSKASKEEIEEIKKIKGEIIGTGIKEDFDFILRKEGEEGPRKVLEEMKNLGFPIDIGEIDSFKWYPFYKTILYWLVARDIFQWDDDVFRENGRFSAKTSVIAKIMMKYFVSLNRCFEQASNFWKKYFTEGELKTEDLNEKERHAFLVLSGVKIHPVYCRILEGFFWQIVSYVAPKENLKVEEIECVSKGSSIHKFKVTW